MKVSSMILPITHPRGHRYDPAHQAVQSKLINAFGGYTETKVAGAWKDDEGILYHDQSVRYDVAADWETNQRAQLAEIAHAAGVQAKQQCVFVQWDDGEVEFLDTKGNA